MPPNDPTTNGQSRPAFPTLPIVTADAPRLTEREKYGGLFYLGAVGLAVVVAVVGWFGWSVWSLRDVWRDVYVLHDTARSEDERIQAAYRLSRDVRVTDQQRWDIALRRPLPPLARYLVAESLTARFVKSDPREFARVVALSEGWPDWLRALGVRAMAVAAAEGGRFPADALDRLADGPDPSLRPWVEAIRACEGEAGRDAADRLRDMAQGTGDDAAIARGLALASASASPEGEGHLAEATRLLRTLHPDAARVWDGWAERDGRLGRVRP